MNTWTFVFLVVAAEAWIVWLAYAMGHSNGWCEGMEDKRTQRNS